MFDEKTLQQIAHAVSVRVVALMQNGNSGGDPNSRNGNKVLPRLLTIKEAAVYLGRSESALYHLKARREIPYVMHGRNLRFDRVALDRWLEADRT